MSQRAAGWMADPSARFELRYWDGTAWTEHVSRSGVQSADPDGVAVAASAEQMAPAAPVTPTYSTPPPVTPPVSGAPVTKNKTNGCLIAFLVVFGIIVVIGVVSLLAIGLLGHKVASNVENAANAGKDDVKITSCEPAATGPVIEVEINNHSSKSSNYIISISLVNDSGTEVGSVGGAAQGVPPDVKRRVPLSGSSTSEFSHCKVATVTRFATRNGA